MGRRRSRSERRAAGRRGGRAAGRPRRSALRRIAPWVLGAAVLGAGAWFVWERSSSVPLPPEPVVHTTADGVLIATLDQERLQAWCRQRRLPPPPGIVETEGEFATELLAALHQAAVTRTADAYGKVGMICESVESHNSALAYFDLAMREDPQDFRWPYYVGCIHQVTGRRDEALRSLREATRRNPAYAIAYARLGQLELETGNAAQADSLFQRYTALQPNDWLGLVGSARVALDRRDPAKALTLLQEAQRRGGDDFQVNRLLGRTQGALGNRAAAAAHFERAESLPQGAWYRSRDPLDEALHRSASAVTALENEFQKRSTTQDWDGLVALAEEILRRRSGDVTMLGNLAGLYRKVQRFDDAHRTLDRAFAIGTDSLRLHNLRAEVFLAQNDFPATLQAVDAALALDPESARAHGVRARALFMLDRTVEAKRSMARCLELSPGDAGNLLAYGEILLTLGEWDAADQAYRAVLEAVDHPLAHQRIAEIAANRP